MDTVNPVDKLNEAKRLQEALRRNPNDINSQLKLAPMIKDLELRRKWLNRTLSLDPANKTAREMLLEMDRAEMGGDRSQTISSGQASRPVSGRAASDKPEKMLVLRYSIVHQLFVYLLAAISGYISLTALQDGEVFIAGFFLLPMFLLWFVTVVVKVNSSGIMVSRVFGIFKWEIAWNDIATIKPNTMGVGMKLSTAEGRSVKISSQVYGYSTIVEILRKIRPDLFNITATSPASREETKTFKKSFFAKYGPFFLLIPATLIGVGAVFVPPFLPGIVAGVFLFFFWKATLSAAHLVKLEENRISTETFLKRRELTAAQITDINVITVRNHRGVAKNFVQIESVEGDAFRFSGFREGNEILYGFLMNWWHSYQNR